MAPNRLLVAILVGTVGCADELPGHHFTVDLVTPQDQQGNPKNDCTDPPEHVAEEYAYRVVLEGEAARIYIGEALLATGSLDVCTLTYQSPTWQTRREEGVVRWAVLGEAQVGLGSGCDEGWTGWERLQVVESTDPSVPANCSVEYDATGTYEGETE